jgi:hypothetical protein
MWEKDPLSGFRGMVWFAFGLIAGLAILKAILG